MDGGFDGAKEMMEEVWQEGIFGGRELGLGLAAGTGEREQPGGKGARGDFGRDVTGFGDGQDDGAGASNRPMPALTISSMSRSR